MVTKKQFVFFIRKTRYRDNFNEKYAIHYEKHNSNCNLDDYYFQCILNNLVWPTDTWAILGFQQLSEQQNRLFYSAMTKTGDHKIFIYRELINLLGGGGVQKLFKIKDI